MTDEIRQDEVGEGPLSVGEVNMLAHHEAVIGEGLKGFMAVGQSMAKIRAQKLYRAEHDTFQEYLKHRWNLGPSYAYRLIKASETATRIKGIENEAQARAMQHVPYSDQPQVWQRAKDSAALEGRSVSAPDIMRAANEPTVTTGRITNDQPWLAEDESTLFEGTLSMITALKRELVALANHPHGCWFQAQIDNCEAKMDDIRAAIKYSRPDGPCPICAGGLNPKCSACRGRGWLPKGRLAAVLKSQQDIDTAQEIV